MFVEVNQESIVRCGGLEALVPLLESGDKETVIAAVAALRNLSIRRGNEVNTGLIILYMYIMYIPCYMFMTLSHTHLYFHMPKNTRKL